MDTQDSFCIRIFNTQRCSSEVFIDLKHTKNYDVIFTAKESDRLICLQTNDKYSIAVESCDSDSYTTLSPNIPLVISDGVKYQEHSYLPGQYQIKVNERENEDYLVLNFIIEPLPRITNDSLTLIKEALDKFQSGLWVDFFANKNKDAQYSHTLSSSNYYVDMMYFIEHFRILMGALQEINTHPVEKIEKTYKVESFPKKQDIHTQRWENREAGYRSKGLGCLYLNKKIITNYNSDENIYLKYILRKLIHHVGVLENDMNYNIGKAKIQLLEYKDKKTRFQQVYNDIKNNKKVAKNYKDKMYRDIHYLKKDIKQLDQVIIENEKNLYNIRLMKQQIVELVDYGWMGSISMNACPRLNANFLMNRNYKILYNLYLFFIKKEIDMSEKNSKKLYMSKRTSELYELYNLIMVFYALKKRGFEFRDSKDSFQALFSNLEACCFHFADGDYFADVYYDVSYQEEIEEDSGFISQGRHNKPDIVLLVRNAHYEALFYIIIEVKCRRFCNIYVEKGNTEVMETARDYANNIKYIERNKIKNVNKQVLIVYPEENYQEHKEKYETYKFLSSNITLNYEENYLYQDLLRIFEEIYFNETVISA